QGGSGHVLSHGSEAPGMAGHRSLRRPTRLPHLRRPLVHAGAWQLRRGLLRPPRRGGTLARPQHLPATLAGRSRSRPLGSADDPERARKGEAGPHGLTPGDGTPPRNPAKSRSPSPLPLSPEGRGGPIWLPRPSGERGRGEGLRPFSARCVHPPHFFSTLLSL